PRDTARATRPSAARRAASPRGARARCPRRGSRPGPGRSRVGPLPGDARLDEARPLAVRGVEAHLAEHLEAAAHARLGLDAVRLRSPARAGRDRRHAAGVALEERDRLRAEAALAALVGHGVVRRREASGVEEILELAQAPGAQLRRLARR